MAAGRDADSELTESANTGIQPGRHPVQKHTRSAGDHQLRALTASSQNRRNPQLNKVFSVFLFIGYLHHLH